MSDLAVRAHIDNAMHADARRPTPTAYVNDDFLNVVSRSVRQSPLGPDSGLMGVRFKKKSTETFLRRPNYVALPPLSRTKPLLAKASEPLITGWRDLRSTFELSSSFQGRGCT